MSASISQSLLIDLGERDRAVEWLRPARRRVPRLTAAIALVAVAMLIPTSSQRARPVIAPALWRAPGADHFVVDKDRVYLINRPGDGYDGVTALSARTGAPLWRLRWQDPVMNVAVLSGGILAVTTHPEIIGEPVTAQEPTVHVVDANGGLLAEFHGVVMAVVPGTDILVALRTPFNLVGDACESTFDCTDLAGVRARTGLEVWRLPARRDAEPIWGWRSTPAQGVTLGVVDSRGHVILYDVVSGRAIRDVPIPNWEGLTPAGADSNQQVILMGGVVLTLTRDTDDVGMVRSATIAAANLQSGQVWKRSVPVIGGFGANHIFHLGECGRWVCLWEETQTTIFDPATGATIRSMPERLSYVVVVEDLFLRDSVEPPGRLTMMNPVTGEVGDSLPGLSQTIERPDGLPLFVVPRTRGPGNFVYKVSRAGEFSLVTTIERVWSCQAAADLLVCSVGPEQPDSPPDAILAWRLPSDTTS